MMTERREKRCRISDIAAALNLSPTTVSFVLNGRSDKGISGETAKLVLETACGMGYKPKNRPSMLGWTKVVFLTSDIARFNFHTSFFAGVYNHMQRKSRGERVELSLMEFQTSSDPASMFRQYRRVADSGAEVVLSNDRRVVESMLSIGMTPILVQGGLMPEVICVHCDDYAAGSTAAEHALKMGHRRAGTIFPESPSPRLEGFKDAFTAAGGECPDEFQWIIPLDHARLEKEVAARIADAAPPLPTIFHCFADNMMFPIIRGLAANGLSVPDDVSLIGADNLYWGAFATPAFTTVDLSEELFADKLLEAVKHAAKAGEPYQLAIPVKLVERESVKKIN